ncbi:tumor necrosis factor receptor superfamily member 13B [Hoplias malabaricus]|uniref:tumor necrosis factor receptor superfamily member 13B n=1 Tax=Hoplias malabaricus TaxID=27720 RepID=UPI00346259E4
MFQPCRSGTYWDSLVRQCLSCEMVCDKPDRPARCADVCVAFGCNTVSGQFYDRLLKKCLTCSDLCGHHPPECSRDCPTVTPRPGLVSTPQLFDSGRSPVPRDQCYSEALVFSLLGLCFVLLLGSTLVALMFLLWRARGQGDGREKDQRQTVTHRQVSKDRLMAEAKAKVSSDRARATETCVHCFSEQQEALHLLYQQAVPQCISANQHHCNGNSLPLNQGNQRDDTLRIICSPAQTSM